jgi:hypothetical protein
MKTPMPLESMKVTPLRSTTIRGCVMPSLTAGLREDVFDGVVNLALHGHDTDAVDHFGSDDLTIRPGRRPAADHRPSP